MPPQKSSPEESMQAPKLTFGAVESFSMSFSVDDCPLTMNPSLNYLKRLEVSRLLLMRVVIGRWNLFDAESFIRRRKTTNCENVGDEFRRTGNDSSNFRGSMV